MKLFIGIFLAVCIIILGLFFATQSTHGQREEATVVQKGQVTGKERAYSKEYKKLYPDEKAGRLSERRKEIQNLGVGIGGTIDFAQDKDGHIITEAQFLQNLSCQTDVIVLGSTINKSAHMTEDETLVYTEYKFLVKNILKNNPVSPIEVNKSIEITRPGGVIKLDGRRIQVEDPSYAPLQNSKQYLLFLRYVSAAKGYIVSNLKGDFVLEGNTFHSISAYSLPEGIAKYNSQNLISDIHNSISSGCGKKPAEGKQ